MISFSLDYKHAQLPRSMYVVCFQGGAFVIKGLPTKARIVPNLAYISVRILQS